MSYILLENVSFTYTRSEKIALKNISLSIEKGEKIAITGLNGSGKSTLSKLITGLLKGYDGKINLDGKDIKEYSLSQIGKKLGYVYQNPNQMLFNKTVYDEIAFGLRWQGKKEKEVELLCEKYLNDFELNHLKDKNPFLLSEGQKQLVVLSSILALKPEYLILDEPTKSIDQYRRRILKDILLDLWSSGTGIIVISHDERFIEGLDDRKMRMEKGEIVFDRY